MSNTNSPYKWKRALSELGAAKQSRFSKIVATIGSVAAVVFLSLLGLNAEEGGWVVNIFLISAVVAYACFVTLAVRYLSIHRTGRANARGIAGVFGRVLLYIFLPAVLITFILVAVALNLRQ